MGERRQYLEQISIRVPGATFALSTVSRPREEILQATLWADAILSTKVLDRKRTLLGEAHRWTYILRARERWIDDPGAVAFHEADATITLMSFGLTSDQIHDIAESPVAVVRMPFDSEAAGWSGRIFPWEYVIAAATRRYRRSRTGGFAVMREFTSVSPASPWEARESRTVLFVQSAPATLGEWGFDGERQRIERAFEGAARIFVVKNPTLKQLEEAVRKERPDIVHLTGFDNAQGVRELARTTRGAATMVEVVREDQTMHCLVEELAQQERQIPDGYLVASETSVARLARSEELARALTAGGTHCAYLVGFALGNSAARTASLAVARGAALSAIGFQDVLDDALSEYFFEVLYGSLVESRWQLPSSFQFTWAKVRQEPDATRATGVALWASRPLLPDPATAADPAEASERYQVALKAVPAFTARGTDEPPVRIEIEAARELNYSVLHNRGGLFKRFIIERGSANPTDAIGIDVEVHLGSERACYRKHFLADKERWNLTRDIHVPLTSAVARAVREAIISSVGSEVTVNGRIVCRETKRVVLLPVDQWRDNVSDGVWLPSFVQPRDPAVVKALEQAQRYVRVLRDDPTAGFEGYQAAPGTEEDELREVDLQVQAIWACLLHDWNLGYINPPPGYSEQLDSQRLRTPRTILEARAGTCIDLALMFAACLELIDVYPVIFLLDGHALPGYWRHHSYQDDYRSVRLQEPPVAAAAEDEESSPTGVQKEAWQAGAGASKDIVQRIRARELVPVETVRLTEHCGFFEAVEAGIEALAVRKDFHSMLDIVTARQAGVTPLPVTTERT